ncbi:MAG: alpha/beta fold hydrolase [Rhodobacter sp.]|nr:alpha/beta fold hydrolase [Rhodobacter sp.]MCA3518847.1 alpha/beta fold hydrolase [Rhodobacter sp.]MCA3526127.1 alpha/beta fold hydrolase [Rhodobacter sp.]MCA3527615.1 alpha/beta fold hydrolase [Rhodobacter sp.]MCA3530452.1 alpha/beta fold hydrolase [Rhodobacter sp.]
MMRKVVLLVAALCGLAACGQRGVVTVDPAARAVGTIEPIFVGTTRAYDPATGSFGAERSPILSLARFDISVPPVRAPGEIRWPPKGRAPDPYTEFVTADDVIYPSSADFRRDLHVAMRDEEGPRRRALIFVHGFNNTFAEGLYRLAQLSHDLDLPRVTVHYSWPSAGHALGYIHDRDSSLYARDGFEKLFNEVVAAGAQEIIVVGHSMGAQLLVESLRQMDIRDAGKLRRYLAGVVLLSPDIDIEVFKSQASTFGDLPQPFLILSSSRDRALRLSSFITGQPNRLGNISDIEQVSDLDVRVIDIAAYSTGSGHFTIGDSPELITLLNNMGSVQAALDQDRAGRVGLLPGLVLTAQKATAIVVSPAVAINNELTRP